jgi:hypothetical protein
VTCVDVHTAHTNPQGSDNMTMTNTRAALIALFVCWAQLSTSFTIQQPRSFVARSSRCDEVNTNTGSSCVVLRPTRFAPPVLQMAQAQVSVCKLKVIRFGMRTASIPVVSCLGYCCGTLLESFCLGGTLVASLHVASFDSQRHKSRRG